ncbi:MAG: DUF3422 domain-containing protein [Nitrococcus sp.]|nr:DUF3422 domain-containing protein [Nitrococcus sp.]
MNDSKRVSIANRVGLPEHPQRRDLLAEVHARPVVALRAPQHLSHLALYVGTGEQERARELAHLAALCRELGIDPPATKADHVLLETKAFRLRWEPHTEFSTYTLFSRELSAQPFQVTGLDAVPAHWIAELPGELLAASHLSLMHADTVAEYPERLGEYFDLRSLTGSRCAGGAATVWTDFQPQPDGFTRLLVLDRGLRPAQAGRLTQRLLEIETYRLMALLALPIVRQLRPEITQMENALGDLTARMASADSTEQEQGLLESLSSLSAQVERIIAQSNFRFGAAAAYSALVRRRIDALRETRVEGVSTVHEFMGRRLVPAMDTCQAIAERLDRLSGRVSRAVNLLRSRVDLALEAQNRDLLRSMNRRTRLQLRLQTTVESLSVVILSYYTIGLFQHVLFALEAAGWHVPVELLTGISIPFVIAAVAGGVFTIHRWVERADAAK